MITAEMAKHIRCLQIFSRKAVNSLLAGEYLSVFKGSGIEFEEVRPYQPGDDIRDIDWNVTARSGAAFVKRYREERQRTILFVMDLSASGEFGSGGQSKKELLTEVLAVLAFAAVKNNDRVGLVSFTEQVEQFIPPQKGVGHALRILSDVMQFAQNVKKTDILAPLHFLGQVMKKRAVVFILSDFQAHEFDNALRLFSRRHDTIAVSVRDPRESRLPDVGLLQLEDAESGATVLIDTSAQSVRMLYEKLCRERAARLRTMLRQSGVDQIELETGRPFLPELLKFFRGRERRMLRGR